MSENPHTVSFYGTDGSGKSSISNALSTMSDEKYAEIGGSSYKIWLTDDVARLILGPAHKLNEYSTDLDDVKSLYEDIAIACYGLAEHLNTQGTSVLIDSDPYMKRIIWSSVKAGVFDFDYLRQFEAKMSDYLSANTAPSHIVAVNMDNSGMEEQLLKRIQTRGANSDHDPVELSQMKTLSEQVKKVWCEIELAKTGLSVISGFNNRFGNVQILHVENPDCSLTEIEQQSVTIARTIKSELNL